MPDLPAYYGNRVCGIVGIFDFKTEPEEVRQRALSMACEIRHRGPDWSGIYADDKAVLAHERLAIVDPESGAQPLIDKTTGSVLCVNGEIYSHASLEKKLKRKHAWQTKSDCEVILYLYDEFGSDFVEMLSGIFAFVLYDKRKGSYLIARDHIGIEPLYVGWDGEGALHVASEMKALSPYCGKIIEFPPGCYYDSRKKEFTRWYKRRWMTEVPKGGVSLRRLRSELDSAVKRQLMSDVPYGVLVSGGLDSSLVAALAAKHSPEKLHSFSVGLEGAPDTKYARKVAEYIGTAHHEVLFTVQEGIDAIRDVIYHLETFDTTTIRAGTPMYLMARKIKSMGIKMVLSGEGSDEVFGGYLYFHKAPDAKEFHEETVRKLLALSKYDCLRANKAMAAWGVETRVPFLDEEFLDYAMSIDPEQKMCSGSKIEKSVLREAFDGVLPKEILWRQKEQFSDGVGYGWIDYLKEYTERQVSDKQMRDAKKRFPVQTPTTKEQYYYRTVFDSLFPGDSAALTVPVGPSIACSTPAAARWSKEFRGVEDPSGRAVSSVHRHGLQAVAEKAEN